MPGGFGTGKTVLLQQIAKHCDADVIVYVGCGERGNEMADVLEELPRLEDPRTGRPLMERTVLIANTSNMPVLAREASIHTGVTVAEYLPRHGLPRRADRGLDVALGGGAARDRVANRPAARRGGVPAGLASALAAFYERAGRGADARRGGGLGDDPRRGLASGRRSHRAGRARTRGGSRAARGRSTGSSRMRGTTRP